MVLRLPNRPILQEGVLSKPLINGLSLRNRPARENPQTLVLSLFCDPNCAEPLDYHTIDSKTHHVMYSTKSKPARFKAQIIKPPAMLSKGVAATETQPMVRVKQKNLRL